MIVALEADALERNEKMIKNPTIIVAGPVWIKWFMHKGLCSHYVC